MARTAQCHSYQQAVRTGRPQTHHGVTLTALVDGILVIVTSVVLWLSDSVNGPLEAMRQDPNADVAEWAGRSLEDLDC